MHHRRGRGPVPGRPQAWRSHAGGDGAAFGRKQVAARHTRVVKVFIACLQIPGHNSPTVQEVAVKKVGVFLFLAVPVLFPPTVWGQGPEVDTGTTAWMLTSTALVLLMIPGLAMFYGGLVRANPEHHDALLCGHGHRGGSCGWSVAT